MRKLRSQESGLGRGRGEGGGFFSPFCLFQSEDLGKELNGWIAQETRGRAWDA